MKVTIPEIAWHNRDPVFSADFSMGEGCQWRMATAGADSDVKVCLMSSYIYNLNTKKYKLLPMINDAKF